MDAGDSWESCYRSLSEALNAIGKESPFGEGDFWIVDDDYGYGDQKICVFELGFLNGKMIEAVQKVLRAGFLEWRVFVVLEIPKLLAAPHKEGGLLIYPHHVEQHWDRQEIEAILGEPLTV